MRVPESACVSSAPSSVMRVHASRNPIWSASIADFGQRPAPYPVHADGASLGRAARIRSAERQPLPASACCLPPWASDACLCCFASGSFQSDGFGSANRRHRSNRPGQGFDTLGWMALEVVFLCGLDGKRCASADRSWHRSGTDAGPSDGGCDDA